MIDRVVLDRYRVDSQIGVGGMGIVYRAHDTKLRRDVALKVIAPHLVQDDEARARFLREAQAMATLSHPNIVTVYDMAEDPASGNVFIVMELLNGSPLRKKITDPARPSFYDMAIQLCRALESAHTHGVLHRDIKPENVFVCSDGTIKLMDFGLARLVDASSVSQSGMMTGTIAYMSPEQLKSGSLDARTDLYSLGILFYEYLCGQTPFQSDNPGSMLLKHLTEQAPSLRAKVPSVPQELEALILRLLSKEPSGRFPSAMVLRDTLERMRVGGDSTSQQNAQNTIISSIPLTIPKEKKRGFSVPRSFPSPPRHTWRVLLVLSILISGAAAAFTFGDTVKQKLMEYSKAFAKNNEKEKKKPNPKNTAKKQQPPKRTSTSSSTPRKTNSTASNPRPYVLDTASPRQTKPKDTKPAEPEAPAEEPTDPPPQDDRPDGNVDPGDNGGTKSGDGETDVSDATED